LASTEIEPTQNLSLDETAQQLGVCIWTVHQLIRRGEIASLKIGRRRLIPQTAITQYVAERLEGGAQ
jgi:excisionase family DNA binding protein